MLFGFPIRRGLRKPLHVNKEKLNLKNDNVMMFFSMMQKKALISEIGLREFCVSICFVTSNIYESVVFNNPND